MDALGLDFGTETESKKINVDNVISPPNSATNSPKLNVTDNIGIELLATTADNLSDTSEKKEEKTIPVNVSEPKMDASDTVIIENAVPQGDEFVPIHRMNPTQIKNEKIDYIYKFKKLGEQGIRTTMNYNMNSNLEDMRNEYLKLKKQREIDNSVKFQRKALMAFVTGIEFLNNKVDPFAIQLDGWSESVNENIFDYDEIFEELYLKYGGDSEVAPEIRLMFALGGSAFMFHLQQTMFKSSMPGMDDIMRQNPDLMNQFTRAAMNSMEQNQPGLSNFMNDFGNQNTPPPPQPPSPKQQPPRQSQFAKTPRPQMREEMKGPGTANIDSILSNLNKEKSQSINVDNSSAISIDDINSLSQGSGGGDRRNKSRRKSDKNTISLAI